MQDPFLPPLPLLTQLVQPICDYLHLYTLPLHIHEILFACAVYHVVFEYVAPAVSTWLLPQHYKGLAYDSTLRWHMKCVSLLQSTTICGLALWVMMVDKERRNMDLVERVWGYTGAAAFVQACATGYFLFDLIVMVRYLDVFGLGMLAHASACLITYTLGFRPIFNYYGCVFMLYELSTPFLNFHWFFDKLGMTGTKAQLYNGLALLGMFFSCRLVWGAYSSFNIYRDVWNALHLPEKAQMVSDPRIGFENKDPIPIWLLVVYLGGHITLQVLNVYWFSKMISAVRKRFTTKEAKKE